MTTKLISELRRLYLLADRRYDDEQLIRHVRGETTIAVDLADAHGHTRAMVIDFHQAADEQHWRRLCDVANALQQELGLPAPAVSVSGGASYRLWLSLASPLTVTQSSQFLALLHQAYFPDEQIDLGRTSVELPPCLHVASGLWAAFINPSMGGALAEDLGLEAPPNDNSQAAFLEQLSSISGEAYEQALAKLQRKHDDAAAATTAAAAAETRIAPVRNAALGSATPAGLLLSDASLEDIVRHLHAQGIEPTFRHVLKH